jgi:hypothetical protein
MPCRYGKANAIRIFQKVQRSRGSNPVLLGKTFGIRYSDTTGERIRLSG